MFSCKEQKLLESTAASSTEVTAKTCDPGENRRLKVEDAGAHTVDELCAGA